MTHQSLITSLNKFLPEENIALIDSEPEIFGYLEISSINVKQYVLADTNENTLELGPGHYNNTALPGTGGNVGIAGHRTTYGAPFGDLDALNIGDRILLTVDSKTFIIKLIVLILLKLLVESMFCLIEVMIV